MLAGVACSNEAAGKGAAKGGRQEAPLPAKKVQIAHVQERLSRRVLITTGSLQAQERATLSVKVRGRIIALPVDLGAAVKTGDLLVQIDPAEFKIRVAQMEAAVAQAEARLGIAPGASTEDLDPAKANIVQEAAARQREAQNNYDRLKKLKQEGVVSESEWEAVEASYHVSMNRYQEAVAEFQNRVAVVEEKRADLALAKQELLDCSLLAPFDGVVERRNASLGEFLSVGASAITLVKVDPVRLRMEVSERDAPSIKLGQEVRLQIEGDSAVYTNKISRVSPSISATNRMLLAEADFPNKDGRLRPGSFAKVEVVLSSSEPTLTIPFGSLVQFAGIQKVFLVKDGKAVETTITVGRRLGKELEVLDGAAKGDVVVLEPGNLRHQQPVEL
ncbi:MAG: efflux RND transporter periplasmic adaptor subunit [Verrucomicrobiales bacterium]